MRISDWSSDVCSSDLAQPFARLKVKVKPEIISFRRDDASPLGGRAPAVAPADLARWIEQGHDDAGQRVVLLDTRNREEVAHGTFTGALVLPIDNFTELPEALAPHREALADATVVRRSEEHTSELQSLMRSSYALFSLKTKTHNHKTRMT